MEGDPDSACGAGEDGGQVGPAGPGHQGAPISLRDGQVVGGAADALLHLEGGEGDGYDEPLVHHYGVRPVVVIRVVGGVPGGGQDTWSY